MQAPPDDTVAAALVVVQDEHEALVQGQIAQAQARANRGDAADEWLKQQQQENADAEGFSPNAVEEIPEPQSKPKRMRKRYVCRNRTWLRTRRLKRFHVGEKVYVKNASGQFEVIGTVNKRGHLPVAFLED
jgi:hypothetical protein